MKKRVILILCVFFTVAVIHAGECINPYTGRQERAETFEFSGKPSIAKKADGYVVRFAVKEACDVTVMVVAPTKDKKDPDGQRIVRHLASGVLGKNAPWPFEQGTLKQELEWDGKDDSGKPVDASKCKIKVGLGLKARLDGILGWAPGEAQGWRAFTVGPNGHLYAIDNAHATCCQPSTNVRVFDHDCRYLRRILPPMSSVTPDKFALYHWNKTTWGTNVPTRSGGHYAIKLSNYGSGGWRPVVTKDGRLIRTVCKWRGRGHGRTCDTFLIITDVRTGATPSENIITIDSACKIMGVGNPCMAVSPDDRWLYLASPISRHRVRGHSVFRMDLKNPGPVSVFLGKPKKAGKDNAHFNKPASVACDKAGNIYVGDTGNERIQVFKPDGSYLKTLPVKKLHLIAVNERSGAIYVQQNTSHRIRMKLQKLGGLNDPEIKASWDGLTKMYENKWPPMAVDASGERDIIWIRYKGRSIVRLEDRGKTFKKLPQGDVTRQAKGWGPWQPWAGSASITADPVREEIYAREGSSCWPSPAVRADGRTGKVIERITKPSIETMAVNPDNGCLYARIGQAGPILSRYNPDTRKWGGLKEEKPVGGRWGKISKNKMLPGITFAAEGGARAFQDQMTVAPNGDIYMPVGLHKSYYDELKKIGQDMLWKKRKMHPQVADILKVYSSDGTLKCLSALPGLGSSNGIGVGRHGAVYMVLQCQPVGVKMPEGLAPGSRYHGGSWGTLVKFKSSFDKYPIGRINGRWAGGNVDKATHRHGHSKMKDVRIENMHWDYPGASPVRMGGCTCHRSTISLDLFERVFVPAAQTCTVNVLDANGNIVLRIGAYGNADSRGKNSPVPDPETGELRPRREGDPDDLTSPLAEPDIAFIDPTYTAVTDEAVYVLDRANERIVRAGLGYATEAVLDIP